jgi:hypothetical protein
LVTGRNRVVIQTARRMGRTFELLRGFPLAILLLCLLATSACVLADAEDDSFDIPAQPAGAALNEFARQADVTLIFSYDLVAEERTRPLKGSFSIDEGLGLLLAGTSLSYQRAVDGTYLICPSSSCGSAPSTESGTPGSTDRVRDEREDGGNESPTRLKNKPVVVPGT